MKKIPKKERCIALLALHFQQKPGSPPNGLAPSVEELEALCGLGDMVLGALRRQQLMQHIAHDEEVYRRWLEVVEYNVESQVSASPNSLNSRLKDIFDHQGLLEMLLSIKKWFQPAHVAGLITTIAVLLVVFVVFSRSVDSYQVRVDSIYNVYSNFSVASPPRGRSVKGSISEPAINPAKLFIAKGVKDGLVSLDRELEQPLGHYLRQVPESNSLTQKIAPKERDLLVSLGRLMILTHYQCRHRSRHQDFTQAALPIYKEIVDQLIYLDYVELEPLKQLTLQSMQDEKGICFYSDFMIKELSYASN